MPRSTSLSSVQSDVQHRGNPCRQTVTSKTEEQEIEEHAFLISRRTHLAAVLQDSLELARRLTFCSTGRLNLARTLADYWLWIGLGYTPSQPVAQSQMLLTKAIAAVKQFEALKTSIEVDSQVDGCVQIQSDQSSVIKLPLNISLHAAEAQYKYQSDPSSTERRHQRQRFVFYLGFVIAKEMHRTIRRMEIPPDVMDIMDILDSTSPTQEPSSARGDQTGAISLPWLPLRVDWMFEESMLGGRLARVDIPWRDSAPDPYLIITGLIIMLTNNNERGHWSIRDDVICTIAEGADDWESYLPLRIMDHSLDGFIAGDKQNTSYRRGDGFIAGREMVMTGGRRCVR